MSFEPREFLRHILAEADFLAATQPQLTRARLEEDAVLQRAVVRSLEIIGEATKRVPASIREANPQVQWRSMARMRDRLVHDYIWRRSRHCLGRVATQDSHAARRSTPHPGGEMTTLGY